VRKPIAFLFGVTAALAAASAQAGEGMPQLDFSSPLMRAQIVWLAIIFAVLYVLLSRWALPKVGSVLEMRAARIAEDLERARQAKAEADVAVAELTRATREAHAAAQAAIAQAVAEAKEAAAKQAASLQERLEAQIAAAEARISEARAAALGALEKVASETTQALVARLIGETPRPEAVQRSVASALAAWRARAAQA
jgi:F-type H+-transporting ATPase subunit b